MSFFAAFAIVGNVYYGQDAATQDWYTYSQASQSWTSSAAPVLTPTPTPTPTPPPTPTPTPHPTPTPTPTSTFTTANGQIYSPSGTPFIARGVDVHDFNFTAASQMLPTTFPGINMVRVDVETYSNPSTLAAAVNALTDSRWSRL